MGGALPQIPAIPGVPSWLSNAIEGAATMGLAPTANAVIRTVNDPGGIKDAASNAKTQAQTALDQQTAQAEKMQQQLLLQPKTITPDNFLANKAKQLANLRLGMAATMTGGSGGTPSPVVSSPTLQGNYPGKAKLGS